MYFRNAALTEDKINRELNFMTAFFMLMLIILKML